MNDAHDYGRTAILREMATIRYPRAFRASISAGSTLWTSPTMPRSAIWKMGASGSLLIATMFFEPFMPTMCWVAPEMPHAIYTVGLTVLPVWPTWWL